MKKLLEGLLPCVGALVTDGSQHDGKKALGCITNRKIIDDGSARIQVQWLRPGQRETSWYEPAQLSNGLSIRQTVQHRPDSVVASTLGVGEVRDLRVLGGREQALVDFPEGGRLVWLPTPHLKAIHGVEHLVSRARPDRGGAEALRLRCLAYAIELWNENTGALSHLSIDPLPHQIHLVHRILRSGNLNWLIADDVGLGKTIEVGMLLSALVQRATFRRILIICPPGITQQWQDELRYKFDFDDFVVHGRDFEVNEPHQWKLYDRVIGSMDRFKQEAHLDSLLSAEPWDLVVFDEAHRLSRRQYGNKFDSSQRFDLAAKLRHRSDNFLLLSATPHQGMQDKFQALLELLRPDRKHDIRHLDLNPEILADMVIRNNKADVTDADGEFIFKGKTTHAVSVPVSDAARAFDTAMQSYLRRGYAAGQALGRKGNAIGFVMTVYRKLAASSVSAIHTALQRRLVRISAEMEASGPPTLLDYGDDALFDDSADERYVGELEEAFAGQSGQTFFAGERDALKTLIEQAESLLVGDQKLRVFIEQLVAIIDEHQSGTKILIFTEYRATQAYLQAALERRFGDNCVELIHGGQAHDERRAAIERFEDSAQFLVSTEAGGEGINLQRRCHVMVNYDLPWNPMRLVQRIGRLYRYGQKERVIVFNMHAPETIDAEVVGIMYERLAQVARDMATLGGEFRDGLEDDILGQMADLLELDIEQVIEQARGADITRSQARIDDALRKAREATERQAEMFSHVAGYDPSEIRDSLTIDKRHLLTFVESMLKHSRVEIVQRFHQGREWELQLSATVQQALPALRSRLRVTLDRDWAAQRPRVHMLDLTSPLMQHLVQRAKGLAFGGRAAGLSGLQGLGFFAGVLRWQNTQAQRMRQEFLAVQIGEDGRCRANTREVSDWLARPCEPAEVTANADQLKRMVHWAAEHADHRLSDGSNTDLHPENRQWLAAGWL
ncbi:helicase-related protein [Salinisphaera aquimarina]|uniref:Helicase-related protein n=1 Tax=Salinisphaera aquimarina TaxID=2094031 RepID=A0ABV7ER66_9GAMM